MTLGPLIRLAAPALAVGLLSIPVTAYAGDTDDAGHFGRLDLSPADIGGAVRFTLRAPAAAKPAVLLVDAAVTIVDPDGIGSMPFLYVLSPSALLAVLPTVGSGFVSFTAPVPNDFQLLGATFFAQAITVNAANRFEATNLAATTIGPTTVQPLFIDASGGIPAIALGTATHSGSSRDLDHDGDPDLVLATGAGVLVFRNDGNLSFTDITSSVLPPEAAVDAFLVELFDADGDKDPDIFVGGGLSDASNPPLPNFLLLNQQSQGSFAFVLAPLPQVAGLPQEVAVSDLDRDGDLDLVLANGKDGIHAGELPDPNALLVNDGSGGFAIDAAFQSAPWNGPSFNNGVTAGDIDNDGDQDLLISRADTLSADGNPGQPNVLLRSDGGLAFTDVSATHLQPPFSDNSRKARFGDFDSDGDLDLVVANSLISVPTTSSGELYFNDGAGVFTEDPAAFPQITESELAIGLNAHTFDADLDGDLDVLLGLHEFFDFNDSLGVPGGTGGDDLLMVNQGGGQIGIPGTFVIDPTYTTGGAFVKPDSVVADFDLDGDDDIYVCAEGGLLAPLTQDRLLANQRIP